MFIIYMELSNILTNRIIIVNIVLTIIGYTLFKKYNNKLFLFMVFYVFILNEMFYYLSGRDIYHSHDRTELCYSINSIKPLMTKEHKSVDSNLTEGIFYDGKCISSKQSERNRFDEFIRLLGIKKGDAVLDAGCGFGGLVMYLRSKGINAEGITITKTQYKENIRKHGNYFHYGDYTIFKPQFVNKFDYIILPGSLEHPFGANPRFISSYKNKAKNMTKMFSMMKKYFKRDSKHKKILVTCLHANPKFIKDYRSFITERMFGGLYPLINKYSVADSLNKSGYSVLLNEDKSWHYYYASYCDLAHFGNPFNIGLLPTILSLPLYPHILYGNIYWNKGYWMWQWSNKNHYRRKTKVCDPKTCDLEFIKNIKDRPVTLFYTVAQIKD